MAKDAYYFSHDSNAKDDPKCVLLIEQLGLEGYGIFWVLIETLREQPCYKYPMALLPALSRRFNTTSEKMKAVVCGYSLFEVDENEFFSVSLMERMKRLEAKREQTRQAGIKSAQKRLGTVPQQEKSNDNPTGVERSLNECSTSKEDHSKEDHSKLNEIKEDHDREVNVTPEKFYGQNIGMLVPYIAEAMKHRLDEGMEPELIIEAMKFAIGQGICNWNYINEILNGCAVKNIKTLNQYQAHELERRAAKNKKPEVELTKDGFPKSKLDRELESWK